MTKSSKTSTTLSGLLYEVEGVDKDLSPIIFLHAMLCSKEVWEDIPKMVAETTKRKVFVYDARNHGANGHSEDFSFDQNVDDLFQFMKELKVDKAILVGHSMGGVTAIRAALKEPTKVEKLVSVEMSVKLLSEDLIKTSIKFTRLWKKAVEELGKETKLEDVTKKSVDEVYKELDSHEKLDHEKEAYLKARFVYNEAKEGKYSVQFNDTAILRFLNNYNDEEKEFFEKLQESKKKCEVPAYFIYAANSHYEINQDLKDIEKYFKNVAFVEINGKAHFIFVEEPDKFKQELIKCLQN